MYNESMMSVRRLSAMYSKNVGGYMRVPSTLVYTLTLVYISLTLTNSGIFHCLDILTKLDTVI